MQLLLILSALLSALTGAMSGRAPELRSHQTSVSRAVVQVAPARVDVLRPVSRVPALVQAAVFPRVATFVVDRAVPLYASRRRE